MNARSRALAGGIADAGQACHLCGARDGGPLLEGRDLRHRLPGRFRLVRCRRCGHVQQDPPPTPRELAAHYPEDYSPHAAGRGWKKWLGTALRRREAGRIAERLPPGARVLEVGCAAGDLLARLRARGLDVLGVEPGARAAALARERHALAIHVGTMADVPLAPASLDAVVMRMVVEHLPSPREDLRRAAELLRPGGRLFVWTENVDCAERRIFGACWHGYDLPRHLHLFSSRTLRRLLEETGFAVQRVEHAVVTNFWVTSAGYAMRERFGDEAGRWMSRVEPLLHLAALPVALTQALLRRSARIHVVAVRT